MGEAREELFVRIKDSSGEEFVWHLKALETRRS